MMDAEKLLQRRLAIGATQEQVANVLSEITRRKVHTETVRNVEQLVIGIDGETANLFTQALQKLGEPIREEVAA